MNIRKYLSARSFVEELHIGMGAEGKTASIKINYGDRTLAEKLTLQ